MILYLSGPITGTTDYVERFGTEAHRLRDAGYEVVNPVEGAPAGLLHHEYMRRDLPLMLACDGVALLPGHDESQGSKLEVQVARACGLMMHSAAWWRLLSEDMATV